MFKPVGTILANRRFGKSSGAILALSVKRVAKDVINRELSDLGDEILATIAVKNYRNGTLTIGCPQLVAAELYVRSGGLKGDINKVLGGKIIEKIVFRVKWPLLVKKGNVIPDLIGDQILNQVEDDNPDSEARFVT